MNFTNYIMVSAMTVREVTISIGNKRYDVDIDIDVPFEEIMYNAMEQFAKEQLREGEGK